MFFCSLKLVERSFPHPTPPRPSLSARHLLCLFFSSPEITAPPTPPPDTESPPVPSSTGLCHGCNDLLHPYLASRVPPPVNPLGLTRRFVARCRAYYPQPPKSSSNGRPLRRIPTPSLVVRSDSAAAVDPRVDSSTRSSSPAVSTPSLYDDESSEYIDADNDDDW